MLVAVVMPAVLVVHMTVVVVMVVVVAADNANAALEFLNNAGEQATIIGEIAAGDQTEPYVDIR